MFVAGFFCGVLLTIMMLIVGGVLYVAINMKRTSKELDKFSATTPPKVL